jgi:predicted nucleotidyltransferase
VAGATARDLILVNVHGLRPGRATRDVDFGVAVESWAQFELLKERLIATREFAAAPKVQQRLIYTDQSAGLSIPIRLYDHEMDLLETAGFDMELAGAELLGRDVATICQTKVLHQIRSLF